MVYESPYPNGKSGSLFFASYQRYPTWTPSEYCTVPFWPGHWAVVAAGTSARDFGKVTGSLPEKLTSP